MRLWSVHPQLLDVKGLVALWREGLLARKVLLGETKGYRHHPQLTRFKENRTYSNSIELIDGYLNIVVDEALRRKYNFNRTKIGPARGTEMLELTTGQLAFEFEHLREKVLRRTGVTLKPGSIKHHPMFVVVQGPKAEWERA